MANNSLFATIREYISIFSNLPDATAQESCSTPDASICSWTVISADSDLDLNTSPATPLPSTYEEMRTRFKRDLTWDRCKETELRSRKARDRRQRRYAKEEEWALFDHGKEEEWVLINHEEEEEEEVLDSWVDPEYAAERERRWLAWNHNVAASSV